ncbi:uncharacterized protein SPSK_06794 [Sporothrix schenckii 1099-18]|uniref:Uncharacterized protein n=1 Tax=Sporothrix schenckii 1099-18 TaxID=1397361 RepID=A0A0F2MLX9_SPOSC|nr:uncharacterized protein SPSK_06794 [Sporothrix schenckii 1099-18]KJR90039.1 hypothetical protein SPSK_06794 [Sporothrix schenckii 1099-18]
MSVEEGTREDANKAARRRLEGSDRHTRRLYQTKSPRRATRTAAVVCRWLPLNVAGCDIQQSRRTECEASAAGGRRLWGLCNTVGGDVD